MATLPKAFREMTARQRGRVLVIDDDRAIRELLSLHLANRSIVDVNMPYLDGPDFVAALRSDPAMSDIPVVFLTSDDRVLDRAAKLGAFSCLTKPIMADRLLEVVARAI